MEGPSEGGPTLPSCVALFEQFDDDIDSYWFATIYIYTYVYIYTYIFIYFFVSIYIYIYIFIYLVLFRLRHPSSCAHFIHKVALLTTQVYTQNHGWNYLSRLMNKKQIKLQINFERIKITKQ